MTSTKLKERDFITIVKNLIVIKINSLEHRKKKEAKKERITKKCCTNN